MSTVTIRRQIHLGKGRRGASRIRAGEAPEPKMHPPQVSRNARLMAFAIVFDEWLAAGKVRDYAETAAVTGFDRARITKIMNLRLLEPGVQEGGAVMVKAMLPPLGSQTMSTSAAAYNSIRDGQTGGTFTVTVA